MIEVSESLAQVIAAATPLQAEVLPLSRALHRVLAAPVHSVCELPPFTQSAVDGYALRHEDITSAPLALSLVQQQIAAAPQESVLVLPADTAARIFTGGMMPVGADTVVRQELTQRPYSDSVVILEAVAKGTDVRYAGEEIHAGAFLADRGSLLTPGLIGALAMAGVQSVSVARQPRIVVLITGDEVVAPGSTQRPGQIPDANGPLLSAHLQNWQCPPLRIEYVADQEPAVRDAIDRALNDADLVLSTGGVSVGDFDFVPAVSEAVGAERVLWKVAQKPGMPLFVARRRHSLLFGLPGNPASVMVNLHVYVRSALDAMCGLDPAARWQTVAAPQNLKRLPDKTFWMRARISTDAAGQLQVQSLGGQASHMLGNLAKANALIRVPGFHEADECEVLRWVGF
ncbi:MAG: molybdopterin molybdotransferase MoeA [Pseudomonadota bacterium]|nr:molybdopterin molybdotransferase MoeA [Pseudomonadota bacterium]